MTPTSPEHDDDLLERELVSYQECLDSGVQPALEPKDRTRQELPPEIEKSLSGLKHCLDLLNQTRLESATPENRRDSASTCQFNSPGFTLPAKIGKFEIKELLGFGGFGIVYKGVDPSTQREVAIKIPKPERLANSDSIQRFAREASLVAQLDHPNIVPIYACDQHGVIPYIVMPFVQGGSLHHWIRNEEVISFRTAAEIVRQLAGGVAHAHDRNILHRDITPVNILLEPMKGPPSSKSGLSFLPRLMDFGIAKSIDASHEGTITGATIGTVGYMSPEQAYGKLEEIRETTDVYGLGTVLYELICGIPPFRGENDAHTLQMLLRDEVRHPNLIRQGVPRDLTTICLKCLEKSSHRRYHSARELADDLRRFLGGEPIRAKPGSHMDHTVKWCRRNPVKSSLVIATGLAVTALVSVSLWYNSRLTDLLEISENNRTELRAKSVEIRRSACLADTRLAHISLDQGNHQQALRLLKQYVPAKGEEDVRHFAWWFVWKQVTEDSRLIGTHAGRATAAAMTPEGDLAASGGDDGLIHVWEIPSGKLRFTLRKHAKGPIHALQFSPDNRRLVSTGEDGAVRVWDVANGMQLFEVVESAGMIADIAISSDGKTIAYSGRNPNIRILNSETGDSLGLLVSRNEQAAVTSLAFHPREPLLISSSLDGTIRFWNLASMAPDARVPEGIVRLEKGNWCRRIAVSPDGQSLIGGSVQKKLFRWSLGSQDFGKLIDECEEHSSIYSLAWPDRGSPILGYSRSGIRVADNRDFSRNESRLTFDKQSFHGISSDRTGKRILSSAASGEVRFWSRSDFLDILRETESRFTHQDERLVPTMVHWSGAFTGIQLDARKLDGDEFIQGSRENSSLLLFGQLSSKVANIFPFQHGSTRVELSAGGRSLVGFHHEGMAFRRNSDDSRTIWEVSVPELIWSDGRKKIVRVSPDESFVVMSMQGIAIQLSMSNGEILRRWKYPTDVVEILFPPPHSSESTVAILCLDGTLRFIDLKSGKLLRELLVDDQKLSSSLAFSTNGKYLAVGNHQGTAIIRKRDDLAEVQRFNHGEPIYQISFWDHDRVLMTRDNRIHFWELGTGSELLTIPATERETAAESRDNQIWDRYTGVFSISPDGHTVAVPRRDKILMIQDSAENRQPKSLP